MDPYLALKVLFMATLQLLKRSNSVYLALIYRRNYHYLDIMLQVFLSVVTFWWKK